MWKPRRMIFCCQCSIGLHNPPLVLSPLDTGIISFRFDPVTYIVTMFTLYLKLHGRLGSPAEVPCHSTEYLILAQIATADVILHCLTQWPRILKHLPPVVLRAFSLFLLATASSLSSYPPSSLAYRCEDYRSYTPSHVRCVFAPLRTCFVYIGAGMAGHQAEDNMVMRWISGSKTLLVRSRFSAASDVILVIILMNYR
jgi:hypothetical protein